MRYLVYRDDYAGAYVDYDTLVIQLTDISHEATAFYRDLFDSDAPIRFKEVEFSANQLVAFGEVFVEALEAPITGFGYSTMENTFRIGLDKNSSESVQAAESIDQLSRFISVPITIELEAPSEANWLRGGEEIWMPTGIPNQRARFSIGITSERWHAAVGGGHTRATLLTTGHAFIGKNIGELVFDQNHVEIGTLALYRAGQHSVGWAGTFIGLHGDWALIDLHPSAAHRLTSTNRTGAQMSRMDWHVPVGYRVTGTGINTRLFQGTVSQVNQTEYFENIRTTVTGLSRVTFQSGDFPVSGDSGGPIWWSDPRDGNIFTGIHAGRNVPQGVTFFSPLGHVTSNFTPSLRSWHP